MAVKTFDELIKTAQKYSHRRDIDLLIPGFIELAEIEMYNNEGWQLEIRDMGTTSTAVTDGNRLKLPPGFEKARSVKIEVSGGKIPVHYRTPSQMVSQSTTGLPRFFTVIGDQIEFDRTPDSNYTIEVQYYKKPNPLSKTNQTNSVLDEHPNIYLFGALHQVFLFTEDDVNMTKWFAKMQSVIRGANKAAKKRRFGPAPTMRVEGRAP